MNKKKFYVSSLILFAFLPITNLFFESEYTIKIIVLTLAFFVHMSFYLCKMSFVFKINFLNCFLDAFIMMIAFNTIMVIEFIIGIIKVFNAPPIFIMFMLQYLVFLTYSFIIYVLVLLFKGYIK